MILPIEGKFDLVGPSVDDDVRRAIARYGPVAVKESINRNTRPARGRRPLTDWPELREVLEADAREWLAGGDPFHSRSNYSIAKDFADKNPGHSHPGTMKRIERKLAKKREFMTLMYAQTISYGGYPYTAHLRALKAICETNFDPFWASVMDDSNKRLADYGAKMGDVPPTHMSFKEVEYVAINTVLTLRGLGALDRQKGSVDPFGMASNHTTSISLQD